MIPFGGMRIIEDASLTDPYEDWSGVRSPSRARRRMGRGHRQNVVIKRTPKKDAYIIGNHTIVMHPVMAAELRWMTKESP